MKDKQIRVGIIGLGYIGKVHAAAYTAIPQLFGETGVRTKLAAVLRTHTGDEPSLIASLGNPLETSDIREFINQDLDWWMCVHPMDFIFNRSRTCSPPNRIFIVKSQLAGIWRKRVKWKVSRGSWRPDHTAFTYRYYPAARQLKSILAAGVLGEIFNFRVHYFLTVIWIICARSHGGSNGPPQAGITGRSWDSCDRHASLYLG